MATTNHTFNNLKTTFLTETGLEWKSHLDTYIQYVQAKLLEEVNQRLADITEKIPDSITFNS